MGQVLGAEVAADGQLVLHALEDSDQRIYNLGNGTGSSIREVIAFPKNNRGVDLMTHSPVEVDFKQLREVYISSTAKKG